MHEQLKHDTATAAAHAAVGLCPGCLPADLLPDALSGYYRLFKVTLDAYDHFRTDDAGGTTGPTCVPTEFDGDPEPL